MRIRGMFWGAVVLAMVLGALQLPPPASAQTGSPMVSRTLLVDGIERVVHLSIPTSLSRSAAGTSPVPLVIALHSFASSGKAMAAQTGLDEAAEAGGFIVAYPDAYDLGWNDGRAALGWPSALTFVDDAAFITAIVDDLSASYPVDPARVSLVAFAGGGSLAYRLGCAMPGTFSKIAVVGALMWDYVAESCPSPAEPVSALILMGAQDANFPARGTSQTETTRDGTSITIHALGIARTAAFWAERAGCDLAAVDTRDELSDQVYRACPEGAHLLPHVASFWPRIGPYALNQAGLDATALVLQFLNDEPLALEPVQAELWGRVPREYVAYVPPGYQPDTPLPVVIALHGRPGTAAGMAYILDLNRVAAANNFIVVYPSGSLVIGAEPGREWNYTRGLASYYPQNITVVDVDDAAFLSLVIDDLALDLAIDQRRVYIAGFSNGGFMTQRLACEASNRFAAFASIAATIPPDYALLCENTPPVPILLMHGTYDAVIPWKGTAAGGIQGLLSVPDTVLFWALYNRCNVDDTTYTIVPFTTPSPTTRASFYEFGGCAGDAEVMFYIIEGGGHNLPGAKDRFGSAMAGEVNTDIRTSEVIWEFFSRHELPAEGRQAIERGWFSREESAPTPTPIAEATGTPAAP